MNILLAEDNVVNQRVTVRILEKRGHTIQPVLNGKEAIEALACERFDLMLMDVQMPVMDGLEATAAIRASERETGQHIPIIAMTAHAMTGDREHCLEAGMDDYLSKPVELKSLHAVLERWGAWTKQHSSGEECTHINRPSTTDSSLTDAEKTTLRNDLSIETEVFNFAALRDRVENDLDLLMEMIDLYLSSSPQMMKEIESAVADGNTEKISRAAHTLKGVLRNMCASTCAEAAFQLETIGKAGESERASESLAVLKNEFQRLESTLTPVGQRCKS